MKITLKRPVIHGSETIAELTLREEVVAGDMRGLPMRDPPHWDDLLKIAGRLAAQPDSVMARLSFADTSKVIEVVAGFMGAGLETGPTPSP